MGTKSSLGTNFCWAFNGRLFLYVVHSYDLHVEKKTNKEFCAFANRQVDNSIPIWSKFKIWNYGSLQIKIVWYDLKILLYIYIYSDSKILEEKLITGTKFCNTHTS